MSVDGQLAGFAYESQSPEFTEAVLTAGSIRATIDNYSVGVRVAGAGVTPATSSRSFVNLTDASGVLTASPGVRILVVPKETRVQYSAAESTASYADTGVQFEPRASFERPAFGFPAPHAVSLAGSGQVHITGSFQLVLWNVDFATATTRIETGPVDRPLAPGNLAYATDDLEAYMDIAQGSLSMTLGPGATTLVESGNATAQEFRMTGATGVLQFGENSVRLASQTVETADGAHVRLAIEDDSLQATLTGRPDELRVDTRAIAPNNGLALPWWFSPLAAILIYALYRLTAALGKRGMESAMEHRDYVRALGRARVFAWFPTVREDAIVVQGVSLIQLDHPGKAERVLLGRRPLHRLSAGRSYLLARIAAQRGDSGLAAQYLTECLSKSPGYVAEARADPHLRGIVNQAMRKYGPEGYT